MIAWEKEPGFTDPATCTWEQLDNTAKPGSFSDLRLVEKPNVSENPPSIGVRQPNKRAWFVRF
jgi:hypothetical protein